jgi:Lecithin retinol acyltransferase
MTDVWQIFETQLVPSPGQPRIPVPRRPPARAGLDASPDERAWELGAHRMLPLAAHVITSRVGYTHHGIHVGNGRVVHYSGLSRGWRGGPVEEVSLTEFARGRQVRVRVHVGARCDHDEVVARARSRLGEDRCRALSNNCEHLCEWCIYGENRSRQVEVLRSRSLRTLRAVWRLVGAPLRLLSLLGPRARQHRGHAA